MARYTLRAVSRSIGIDIVDYGHCIDFGSRPHDYETRTGGPANVELRSRRHTVQEHESNSGMH